MFKLAVVAIIVALLLVANHDIIRLIDQEEDKTVMGKLIRLFKR